MSVDGTASPQVDPTFDPNKWTPTEVDFAYSSPTAERELAAWGLAEPDQMGRSPHQLPFGEDREYYRYQYDEMYIYRRGQGDDAEYFPVEFRTYIHTTRRVSDSLKQDFKNAHNPRLQQLFDSGEYQGTLRGFNFFAKEENEEDNEIDGGEADFLGVPQFEVLLHMDDRIQGTAAGFFSAFDAAEEIPDQERWRVTYNSARGDYEFRPQGAALRRLQNSPPKQVVLNGKYIGNTQPSRGTVYLSKTYSSNDLTWKNTTTGEQMWSREKFLRTDPPVGFSSPAVRDGGVVWKVNESGDRIALRATKPEGFAPATVSTSAAQGRVLQTAAETEFRVTVDRGQYMGKFETPSTHRVAEGTDLML